MTHWFEKETREPLKYLDPKTNKMQYYHPWGRYLHVPPSAPDSSWQGDVQTPWWRDQSLIIGSLSKRTRPIRIINTLTKHEDVLTVCSEETLNEILDRYLDLNKHAASYTWKRLGRPLDMDKNLDENDIPDEREEYIDLGIDEESYIPAIHLFYNDDLTIA